jgi:GT2 family glycosyltransferase
MAKTQAGASARFSVTVVIPTYKRFPLALSLAQSIHALRPDAQVIVIEQEGDEEINAKFARKENVEYLHLPKSNTSHAKNAGISHATGDIIFFFDDDVELTSHIFETHIKEYEDPSIVGVSGRVINDDDVLPEALDVETGRTNFLGTRFVWQYWSTKRQYVDFAYGCHMSFRREILNKIGGFNTSFVKIFEEIDLGKRAGKYGKIVFSPEALVYHHKAPAGGTRVSAEDKMRMLYTHYGYYLSQQVPFPISLLSLLIRIRSVLMEAPYALPNLISGYFGKTS